MVANRQRQVAPDGRGSVRFRDASREACETPDLLAGEQINVKEPRRWLLVTREMSVPAEEDGAGKWSLDHLFLDQDAIPTLIEVKRSTDTRIRRHVVGQMLDYAANAVAYWPVEEIRAKFEARCEQEQEDAEEVLAKLLGESGNLEDYWQQVKTNLQAGRIRLVFLADAIPEELRRVVEFLNGQMDPAEVIAIEVKQFVGKGMKTLVPRVLGQTEAARTKKSVGTSSPKNWDESAFMADVEKRAGTTAKNAAKQILDWISPLASEVHWGKGAIDGSIVPVIDKAGQHHRLFRLASKGILAFRFDWLCEEEPFKLEATRRELLSKINLITDLKFDDSKLTKRTRLPLEKLCDPAAMERLKTTVAWMIERFNAGA